MVQFYAMVESYLVSLKDRKDEGQGLVEYALILALISVVISAALITLRGNIEGVFTSIGTAL